MKTLITSIALFVCMTASAMAAEFTTGTRSDGEKFIMMEGPVVKGDIDRLKAAWMEAGVPAKGAHIWLNSPGGDGEQMKLMSTFIADMEMVTIIHSDDICFSACAIMFVHGKDRWIQTGAELGFHGSSWVMVPEVIDWLNQVKEGHGWAAIQGVVQTQSQNDMQFFHTLPVTNPDAFVARIAMFGIGGQHFWKPTSDELWIIGAQEWVK